MNYVTRTMFSVILVKPNHPRQIIAQWATMGEAMRSANRLNTGASEGRWGCAYIVEESNNSPIDKIVPCP